jgi:hypothetical protein
LEASSRALQPPLRCSGDAAAAAADMNAPHGLVTQVGQDSAPPDARTLSLAARLVSVCESDCVVIGCHVCDYECVDDVCACVCVCVVTQMQEH